MYSAALLLSSPVVSLSCTVGKLIEQYAGSPIFFKAVFAWVTVSSRGPTKETVIQLRLNSNVIIFAFTAIGKLILASIKIRRKKSFFLPI